MTATLPEALRGREGNLPPRSIGTLAAWTGVGLATAFVVGKLAERRRAEDHPLPFAARRARNGAAILAGSVLTDSAMEHFRGRFHNRAMFAAPATGAIALAGSLAEPDTAEPDAAVASHAIAATVGTAGLGFHLYNVTHRPGGLNWNNLFYAAPLGAPGALVISGALGLAARVVARPARDMGVLDERGRLLGTVSALSLLATSAEAWLLHFRGAFHNPAMLAPVTVPPAAAAALLAASARPTARRIGVARRLLAATAAIGLIGTLFHMVGVARNMGGWDNASQNVIAGPPVPAPISFSGIALAGLGAVELFEEAER